VHRRSGLHQWDEIAFGNAAAKNAVKRSTRSEKEREISSAAAPGHEKHHEGSEPKAFANSHKTSFHPLKRQCKTQDHRRSAGTGWRTA